MYLIKPDKAYLHSYREAKEEYKNNKINTYKFLETDSYDIFEYITNRENGVNIEGYDVPETYLWMVEKDMFLGEICIRHKLTDSLLKSGGNISYGVRYSKWYEGIGAEMLRQGLKYAKKYLNLHTVLLTCDDDNHGSYHIIEKNGGLLQNKIKNKINGDKKILRRYWVLT